MMATAVRLGFEELKVVSARNLGVALGLDGRIDEGRACLRAALQTQIAHGTHSWLSLFFGWEAAMLIERGRTGEAGAALDRAFDNVQRHEERFWEAELHRLCGELRLAERGTSERAEDCFQRALEISRSQGARALELRAASSLARLWQRQGREHEARQLLEPVANGFTEGLDTPDMQDARGILGVTAQAAASSA